MISVDLQAYSLNAVKATAYRLGNIARIELTRENPKCEMSVTLPADGGVDKDAFLDRFWQELQDQDLREIIARETEAVRNLIMAAALSKVPLLHPELETGEIPGEGMHQPSSK